MPLQLVVANPGRKKKKRGKATRKKARRRASTRRKPVARKKSTRRRRRTTRTTARRAPTRRRRRSSRSAFGGTNKRFIIEAATAGIGGTVGFIAADMLPSRIPVAQLQSGYGLIAAKALVGVAGGLVLGKFVGRKHGASFAVGAMTNAGVSLYNNFRGGGVAGLGGPIGAIGYDQLAALGMGGEIDAMSDLGDYVMEEDGVY